MKNSLILVSGLIALSLTACNVKTPDDVVKDMNKQLAEDQKKRDEDLKKNNEEIDKLMATQTQGGQPGIVSFSGVIVKDEKTVDSLITVEFETGTGKDGKKAELEAQSKAKLTTEKKPALAEVKNLKNIISMGCDAKVVNDFAVKNGLKVDSFPSADKNGVRNVKSKALILCGNLQEFQPQFLLTTSDELILEDVTAKFASIITVFSFSTNKLTLVGTNSITTQGLATSNTVIPAPGLALNVFESIASRDNGKLSIKAIGSDYKASTTK